MRSEVGRVQLGEAVDDVLHGETATPFHLSRWGTAYQSEETFWSFRGFCQVRRPVIPNIDLPRRVERTRGHHLTPRGLELETGIVLE
jgi:hypothetical protein